MLTCGALALDATDAVDGKSADVEEPGDHARALAARHEGHDLGLHVRGKPG